MMTPKEKAIELIDKHISYSFDVMPTSAAKKLALTSVDEIVEYWNEVRSEIEKYDGTTNTV